jgi:Aspartyl protease
MTASAQFPYVSRDPSLGSASLAPMMPLTLTGSQDVATSALVDSGAAVNVLPYTLGVQLGLDWAQQTQSVALSGNLAAVEARVVLLDARVANFPVMRLAFAWAQIDNVPVILGQVNFFREFDVCFFGSRSLFEVRPKS